MAKALTRTDFNFPGQKEVYHGKVRDVYNINDDLMVMVATDRISAFDVVRLQQNSSMPALTSCLTGSWRLPTLW